MGGKYCLFKKIIICKTLIGDINTIMYLGTSSHKKQFYPYVFINPCSTEGVVYNKKSIQLFFKQ